MISVLKIVEKFGYRCCFGGRNGEKNCFIKVVRYMENDMFVKV